MPAIRTILLNGIALAGCGVGLFSIADGYARNLPDPPERAAAVTWFDPETTTSITPKDADAAAARRGRRGDRRVRASPVRETDAAPPAGWVDPFYRRRDR